MIIFENIGKGKIKSNKIMYFCSQITRIAYEPKIRNYHPIHD